jgi:PilZ domain
MSQQVPALELRKHPRAQLQLPVRIRWQSALGLRLETARTIDVAREGLMVQRTEPCSPMARLWIAFPFDPATRSSVQPETPARVVRVEEKPEQGYRVALHLEVPSRDTLRPAGFDRRTHSRITFALPIFVRPASNQWPQESMTCDVSSAGASFETSRIYAAGDEVFVKIPWGEWNRAGEIHGRVVRVGCAPDQSAPAPMAEPETGISAVMTRVSVRWTKPTNPEAAPLSQPART